MIELESERLRIREIVPDDLPALLPVYLSNPQFVAWSEGSQGEAGYYDLAMLQRDWQVAQMMPGRVMLGIYLKATGEAVGQADYLAENPDDGLPWLGLLMIAGSHQRRGLGSEAFARLAQHFREDLGWTRLRIGVLEQNTPATAFWEAQGFERVPGAGGVNSNGLPTFTMERTL
jgi:RimJ/RimL family protein N-acetyltransferase